MKTVLTIAASLLLVSAAFGQIADFDNVPHAPGFYLQAYPSYSTASGAYDSNGDAVDFSESWNTIQFAARPAYYGMFNEKRWMVSAVIPFVSDNMPGFDSESGIGDMQISGAYWVIDEHKTGTYLSIWLWSELPTGDDTKGLGTGQMNIRPGVAFAKEAPKYRLQGSAYYNLRMKNSDADWKPGNEFWLNADAGYVASPQFMPGLEIQSGFGQDSKLFDTTWPDSKQQWFGVGPYFEYQLQPQVGLKLTGLYNVMGKNTLQAFDIQARVTYGF